MAATKLNFKRVHGDTVPIVFRLQALVGEDYIPYDLTDKTFVFSTVELDDMGSDNYIFQLVGGAIDNPEDGVLGFPFTEQSQSEHLGTYGYDVVVTNADNTSETLIMGKVSFVQTVTQR